MVSGALTDMISKRSCETMYEPKNREERFAMKLLAQVSGLCVFSLCSAVSSVADTIELEATGTVTGSGFASVPVGTPLTAFLFYDPAKTPAFQSANTASYVAPQAEVFEFGGSKLTAPPQTGGWDIFDFVNNPNSGLWGVAGGDDAIGWVETSASATGPIATDPGFDTTGFASFQLRFEAPHSDGVLTSTTLPSIFPSLGGGPNQWTDASFDYIPITGSGASFGGTFSSVAEVPEPGSGSLFLSLITLTALLRVYKRHWMPHPTETNRQSDSRTAADVEWQFEQQSR
jgi:hypothetical protein